jgi:Cu/Ag efflux pump CusA
MRPARRDGLCHHAEPLGEYTARAESRNRLFALAGFALPGVSLLLYIDFESARRAWLVFITLPFALAGDVGAALLTGGVLSLGSLVGFVTVLGIAARDGIMLISQRPTPTSASSFPSKASWTP